MEKGRDLPLWDWWTKRPPRNLRWEKGLPGREKRPASGHAKGLPSSIKGGPAPSVEKKRFRRTKEAAEDIGEEKIGQGGRPT